jgi:predicted transposase/invertase (TIGR01784 family)
LVTEPVFEHGKVVLVHLENAVPYIPKFRYELFDISHMPVEEIKVSPLLRIVLLSMKYIQSTEIKQKLDDILVIFKEINDPEIGTFMEVFSLYIENAAPKDLRMGLLEKIRKNLIAGGNKMSAVTEYFRDEGRRQGLEKGLEEGRKEGREEGIEIGIKKEKEQRDIEIAMIMIKNNEPVEKIALYTGLLSSQISELQKRLS